jgi:hypothetical protein
MFMPDIPAGNKAHASCVYRLLMREAVDASGWSVSFLALRPQRQ